MDVPESYGGLGSDKTTSALVAEYIAVSASFSTAFGAHSGIGITPLCWYGTEEQKQKYLPRLVAVDWVAAYALSEASSGSDAMNIRTRAVLSDDGDSYLLNGEKMWITNAGIADLFIVFAKVMPSPNDGTRETGTNSQKAKEGKFSAFLVERTTGGLTVGKEEHKLGIRGSSTCALIFSDCRVPAANVLGEIGKGHHIAFNILNLGRFKLGAACVGGARQAIEIGIGYAKERKAFGKSIAEFGLIQRKIASSTQKLYVAESMVYRTAGMMDKALTTVAADGAASPIETQKRIEEYAIECSILKVFGSEMLAHVTDELVQIMGGHGYVEEYPAERLYRDARINRIFEGTNEINRLIISGWLMKRALNGQIPLLAAIRQLMDEVLQPAAMSETDAEETLGREKSVLRSLRKMLLLAAGTASQRYMAALQDQQEIMADLADCIASVYALESAMLRALKLAKSKGSGGSTAAAVAMTAAFADEALGIVEQAARRVIAASSEGDAMAVQLSVLRRLSRVPLADTIAMQRTVAQHFIEVGRYKI